MQEEIELVGRALDLPLSHALEQGSGNRLKQTLESTLAIDRVYSAYVYNHDGELVLAVGREPARSQPRIRKIAVEGDRHGEYGQVAGRRIYSYFVPLTGVGGTVEGVLQVTRRRRDFDEHLSNLRGHAARVFGLSAGLMVGLVLWGHHHALGKHVQRLVEDIRRVEHGERGSRASTKGPEEISVLAASLNAMLDSIEHTERTLTEQRRTQAALEERLHQSEKLAAIGGLAAGVAHELGTPLSVVDGHAQRMLRDSTLTPAATRAIEQIRGQVRHIEGIVRELLDFGGVRASNPQAVNAGEIVSRTCTALQELAESQAVTLTSQVSESEVVMFLDGEELRRAVNNVVENAIQAAPGGEVRVQTTTDAAWVRICIDDSGEGIPPEIRQRVFDPFFTTKPVGQGTGLGLALAYRTIQDMGGSVTVRDSNLGGARFEISLPREELPSGSGEGETHADGYVEDAG